MKNDCARSDLGKKLTPSPRGIEPEITSRHGQLSSPLPLGYSGDAQSTILITIILQDMNRAYLAEISTANNPQFRVCHDCNWEVRTTLIYCYNAFGGVDEVCNLAI